MQSLLKAFVVGEWILQPSQWRWIFKAITHPHLWDSLSNVE